MIIKRKLEGRDKLRVWDGNVHNNIYQVNKRTGNSTRQTVITYMRRKQKKNRYMPMYN